MHESILGTVFKCRLVQKIRVGDYEAFVPVADGTAFVTWIGDKIVEVDDPLPTSFTVADTFCWHC